MKKSLRKLAPIILPFVIVILLLIMTDPYSLPLFLVPVPFALFGFGLYKLMNLTLRKLQLTSPAKSRVISGISVSIILLAALLQSIGQLQVRDFLLLAILLGGLVLYFHKLGS